MRRQRLRVFFVIIVYLIGWAAGSTSSGALTISRKLALKLVVPDPNATPSQKYVCGDPTDQEQYLLELVNRARANPPAEGLLLTQTTDADIQRAIQNWSVDVATVQNDFATYLPKPPLAFNAQLMQAASIQAQDMAIHDFQDHLGSDGSTLQDRLKRVGYEYSRAGENVFSYAKSVWYGEAGFLIDWGNPDLGHRVNLLELGSTSGFREAGLSVLSEGDPSTQVGPLVIAQEFGYSNSQVVFLTGIIYRDGNGNQFYDAGEGLSGVTVMPDHGEYYAVSSQSGGYAIPVAVNSGSYRLKIIRSDLPEMTMNTTVADKNIKIDFLLGDPAYASINGKVIDEQSGVPVPGVQIKLSPVDRTCITDNDGGFYFTNLPAATYRVTAVHEGFDLQPSAFTVTLAAGQIFRVQILEKSPAPSGIVDVPAPTGGCAAPTVVLMLGMGLAMITLTGNPDRRPGNPRRR